MVTENELLEHYSTIRRRLSVTANGVLRETGLGLRQFIILRSLASQGDATVSELVEHCMTDPGTVSRSIQQLQESRLVEKKQSKEDKRVWIVRLSAKGREMVPRINSIYSQLSKKCFGHLSQAEKNTLGELLARVAEQLK